MLYKLAKVYGAHFAFVDLHQRLILNAKDWDEWYPVCPDEIFLKIEPMTFNNKTSQNPMKEQWAGRPSSNRALAHPEATAYAMAFQKSFTWSPSVTDDEWQKMEQINKSMRCHSGSIQGLVLLTPSSELIWVSDIDLKYFEEVKT